MSYPMFGAGFRDSIFPLSISTHTPYRTQSHFLYLYTVPFLNKLSDTYRRDEAPQPRHAKRQKITATNKGQGDLQGEKQEGRDFKKSFSISPQYDTLTDSHRSSHSPPHESSHCSPLHSVQRSSLVGRTYLLST